MIAWLSVKHRNATFKAITITWVNMYLPKKRKLYIGAAHNVGENFNQTKSLQHMSAFAVEKLIPYHSHGYYPILVAKYAVNFYSLIAVINAIYSAIQDHVHRALNMQ